MHTYKIKESRKLIKNYFTIIFTLQPEFNYFNEEDKN